MKCLPSALVMIPGSWDRAPCWAQRGASFSLCPSPRLHVLSLFFQINKLSILKRERKVNNQDDTTRLSRGSSRKHTLSNGCDHRHFLLRTQELGPSPPIDTHAHTRTCTPALWGPRTSAAFPKSCTSASLHLMILIYVSLSFCSFEASAGPAEVWQMPSNYSRPETVHPSNAAAPRNLLEARIRGLDPQMY